MAKRVFLVVLDSFGVGEEPDAASFGDYGVNTLRSIAQSSSFNCPNLRALGLFNLDGIDFLPPSLNLWELLAVFASALWGKGYNHRALGACGIGSSSPLPTTLTVPTGDHPKNLNNAPAVPCCAINRIPRYRSPQGLRRANLRTGSLIVYTSADSVFQIAANETIVPVDQLYEYCRAARSILVGEHGVGRVIARPFEGPAERFSAYATPPRLFSATSRQNNAELLVCSRKRRHCRRENQ